MAGIFAQTFGSGGAGLFGVTSIEQLPYLAIGGFGLFLYLLYAGKSNKDMGEKKDSIIGMFIGFAFLLDIFYLHDVWLVTILGGIAGVYALLAFAGVFGVVKTMGKLGYGTAKVVKKKIVAVKAKQKELQAQTLATKDLMTEVQGEREESLLLFNDNFKGAVDRISAERSYFTNISLGQQNISALAHVLIYIRRIEQILKLKEKATAQLMNAEQVGEKAEKKEEVAVKGEEAGEQTELSGENQQIRELISEARILPVQMRGQVQGAISELQQAEARTQGVKAAEAKEIADEKAVIKLQDLQRKMSKELNLLQNRMLKTCARISIQLTSIEIAMTKGGRHRDAAVTAYPPVKFFTDYKILVQEHEQIKLIIQRVIQNEIRDTLFEFQKAIEAQKIDVTELNEDKLLEQAENIKANVDRMLGGKNFKQDKKSFGEIGKEIGVTDIARKWNEAYLKKLQEKLGYLRQMQAALAAVK